MKRYFKLILSIIILLSLAISFTGCGTNSEATSNNNLSIEPDFIEIGETYYLQGHFSESYDSGIGIIVIKAKIIDKNNNWIKVSQMEPAGGFSSISELKDIRKEQKEWDSTWLNLNHVLGITK